MSTFGNSKTSFRIFFSFHMWTEFLDLNWYHVTDVIIHIKYAKFEKFFPHFFFFFSYANRIFRFKLISCYGCDNSHQICEIRKLLSAFFFSFHMRTEFFALNWYHVTDVIIHIKYAKFENFFPHFFFLHMRTEFLDLNWYHVMDVIIHIKYAKFENIFPHFFFFFICEQNFLI